MQNETKVHVARPVHYDQALQITAFSLLARSRVPVLCATAPAANA